MNEDNVISLTEARQRQADANLSVLDVAKRFTSKPMKIKDIVGSVKKHLRAVKLKYKLSDSSCDLSGFKSNQVLIFPDVKLIVEFIDRRVVSKPVDGWIVKQLHCSHEHQTADYVDFIAKEISELKSHG